MERNDDIYYTPTRTNKKTDREIGEPTLTWVLKPPQRPPSSIDETAPAGMGNELRSVLGPQGMPLPALVAGPLVGDMRL